VRALLRWVVLIVLMSGAGLLAGRPGTGAFVLSAVTLGIGLLAGAVLIVLIRFPRRE
jgi:uncharacterized membrane-anchored protein